MPRPGIFVQRRVERGWGCGERGGLPGLDRCVERLLDLDLGRRLGNGNGTVTYAVSANTSTQSRSGTMTIAGQTIAITQAGAPSGSPTPLQFVPIAPCRLVDTRNANGPFGGPAQAAQAVRTFAVASGGCGIPSSAQAYSVNFTAIPTTPLFLIVWPTGQAQPLVSSLNSDGRTKANAAIVAAGTGGEINVYSSASTQFVIDVSGYFAPASSSTLAFYPVIPCRVADTRNANGPLGGPYLAGGSTRAFPILSGPCGVPSTARAYSLNLSALPHGPLWVLAAWATGQAQPATSTLNAPTGTDTANAAIVTAGASGEVSIYTSSDTDLAIDIDGYFAPPGGKGALSLYALAEPCRVYDSRMPSGSNPFTGTISINVGASVCGVSASAQAYVLNAAAIPPGALDVLELWPYGEAQPLPYSTLNAFDGAVTSNLALVGASSGSINVWASNSTDLVLDVFGYFAP